jgi:hypothetical protein
LRTETTLEDRQTGIFMKPWSGFTARARASRSTASSRRALDSASPDALMRMLSADMHNGLRKYVDAALTARTAMKDDVVVSGRAYVKAYVEFMHHVEHLHAAVTTGVEGHDGTDTQVKERE